MPAYRRPTTRARLPRRRPRLVGALQHGTSGKSFVSAMADATRERPDPRVRESIRGDLSWQRLLICGLVELAAAANVDRHGLPVCRPAQLVRAALFPDASAGKVWPLAKFLCRGLRRYFPSHARLRFSSCALLYKSLVARELADGNCHVEHVHVVVDRRADYFARPAELPARLVLGDADRFYVMRFELVSAQLVQSGNRLRASAGRAMVSRSAFAAN